MSCVHYCIRIDIIAVMACVLSITTEAVIMVIVGDLAEWLVLHRCCPNAERERGCLLSLDASFQYTGTIWHAVGVMAKIN